MKPLAKRVLIPLELKAAVSRDVAIYKKIFGSGRPHMLTLFCLDLASRMATLITSNEEINDIMNIVKSHEESGLLIKGVSKTIKNEQKKKGEFPSMLLGT